MDNFKFNNLVSVNKEMSYSVISANSDAQFKQAALEAMIYRENNVDEIDEVFLVFDGIEVAIKANSTLESLTEVYEFKVNLSKSYNIKRDDYVSTISGVDELVYDAIKRLQFSSEGSSYDVIKKEVLKNVTDNDLEIESSISKLVKHEKVLVYEDQFYHIEELKNVYKNKLEDYRLQNVHENIFEVKIGDSSYVDRNKKLSADLEALIFIEGLIGLEPAEMSHLTRILLLIENEKYERKIINNKKLDGEIKKEELEALDETFYVGSKLVSRATLLDEKYRRQSRQKGGMTEAAGE